MAHITGVITIVQEGRFQLTDRDGVSHLFVLSPHAAVETPALQPLAARQASVRVQYEDAPKVVARVASRIDLCAA